MLHSSASASPISMVLGAGAVILRSPARTVSFVSVGRSQSQDDIPAVLAGDLEPALLEHPDRSDVVSGDIGVEGASLLEVQQLRERPCGDAPPGAAPPAFARACFLIAPPSAIYILWLRDALPRPGARSSYS